MKLTKVRIGEFQSIWDSTEFEIGDVTCLVGKNEAGKTALLKALYRLNPVNTEHGSYNAIHDYPRSKFATYEPQVEAGSREPATVVTATFSLDSEEVDEITSLVGSDCLPPRDISFTLSKTYGNTIQVGDLAIDPVRALRNLASRYDLPESTAAELRQHTTAADMLTVLRPIDERTNEIESLTKHLTSIDEQGLSLFVYEEILKDRVPKFLYFDEYYQMKGQDNLDALSSRIQRQVLEDSDFPLVGLIGLAGLRLDQIVGATDTETLIARLEAAGNQLTTQVLKYWSQNRHLRMKFDIREARPQDGPGMTEGTNIWGRIEDTRHLVTTPLRTRSKGFVWFFSFLAWYDKLRKDGGNLILLLDEPGLSLHARAQADLLSYFEQELRPHHQLIYTTHSPFMVDPQRFDRVRIVQDLSIEAESADLPEDQQGTKVMTDVLDATSDSLFPLQGALGYEIHQSLFIGPNCLIVEGASDLLYIQVMSALLQSHNRPGLSSQWTITPVGGADKVSTFVALIGAQANLNVAVLIDFHKKDQQTVENLYKSRLLKKQNVLTFADYVKGSEADIEDMFDPAFYLDLVRSEFNVSLNLGDLSTTHPRILHRLEQHLEHIPVLGGVPFNHYRPARYFNENSGSLGAKLSAKTLDRFQQAFDALNQIL